MNSILLSCHDDGDDGALRDAFHDDGYGVLHDNDEHDEFLCDRLHDDALRDEPFHDAHDVHLHDAHDVHLHDVFRLQSLNLKSWS